jgi:hypothetical protein
MNRVLLAITILGTGVWGYFTARQSTMGLYREMNAAREAWLAQTQLVNLAQNEQASLIERVRQTREALAQAPLVEENALWSVVQTNRISHLPPELRERLFEELGFNWQSAADYIVVSKETVHDVQMEPLQDDKLSDMAAAVLAVTPEERGQLEAAMRQVRVDFSEWIASHIQRTEPKDDVLAQYTLPTDPAISLSISNNFAAAIFDALGRERAGLIGPSALRWAWTSSMGPVTNQITLIVKRCLEGDERRLKFWTWGYQQGNPRGSELSENRFPSAFRPIFPNGWSDLAKREGFQLPEQPQGK